MFAQLRRGVLPAVASPVPPFADRMAAFAGDDLCRRSVCFFLRWSHHFCEFAAPEAFLCVRLEVSLLIVAVYIKLEFVISVLVGHLCQHQEGHWHSET
jgi:hypothetical protein